MEKYEAEFENAQLKTFVMNKKLKTRLDFVFDIDETIPDIEYTIPFQNHKINKVKIVKSKNNGKRDPSTASRLF